MSITAPGRTAAEMAAVWIPWPIESKPKPSSGESQSGSNETSGSTRASRTSPARLGTAADRNASASARLDVASRSNGVSAGIRPKRLLRTPSWPNSSWRLSSPQNNRPAPRARSAKVGSLSSEGWSAGVASLEPKRRLYKPATSERPYDAVKSHNNLVQFRLRSVPDSDVCQLVATLPVP